MQRERLYLFILLSGISMFITDAAFGQPVYYLWDGGGYWWDILADGSIEDGRSETDPPDAVDSFDRAMRLSINGVPFPIAPQQESTSARMIVTGPAVLEGLNVTRYAYVPTMAGQHWACFIEYLENPGDSPVLANVRIYGNLGSDGDTRVKASSSGDMVFSVDDQWLVCDDNNDGAGDPSLFFQYWGDGASIRPTAVFLPASQEDYYVDYAGASIPPHSTVAYMHFCSQDPNNAVASATATQISGLPIIVLNALNTNRVPVLNWDIPADPLEIYPADTFTAIGPHHGPYTPPSRDYTIRNSGTDAITWSTTSPAWISISPAIGGTLAAGASLPLTMSFNAATESLSPNEYANAVVFKNSSSNKQFLRPIRLNVQECLVVAETAGCVYSGYQGGLFSPESTSYTLHNVSADSPLVWSITTPAWLTATPADSVAAGGPLGNEPLTITITPNLAANSLTPGNYIDSITFNNITFGTAQSRDASITVQERLSIAPEATVIFRGRASGPFDPSLAQWTITNVSTDRAVSWSIPSLSLPDWLSFDIIGDTLEPGESITVTGTVQGDSKPLGDYFDLFTVQNDTFASMIQRAVTLRVKDVLYVDTRVAPPGDGSSWMTALNSIQAGIDGAASTDSWVWVAGGTYAENLVMADRVEVYGGFSGGETLLSQRDPELHPTVIDGHGAGRCVTFGPLQYAGLDGFIITNGRADNTGGGGIRLDGADASCFIIHCQVLNNQTTYRGGGLYCVNNAQPLISGCIIAGNQSEDLPGRDFGGGISCLQSSPTIVSCRIVGNESRYGAGIGCIQSSPRIANCLLSGNVASNSVLNPDNNQPMGSGGGGIFAHDHSSPVITNCVISGNYTQNWGGGALYCQGQSRPTLTNCTILSNRSHNTLGGELASGIVVNTGSAPVLTNCILADMTQYAGMEEAPWPNTPENKADIFARYCLFSNNGAADFHDDDTHADLTGGEVLNNQANGCQHNVAGNPAPRFVTGFRGTWTLPPSYDAASNTTLLPVDSPLFEGLDLRGKLINADRSQTMHTVILSNTDTAMVVPGNIVSGSGLHGYVNQGDAFEILDLHPEGDSPLVNTGSMAAPDVTPVDIDGNTRVGQVDIGAYECAAPTGATVLDIRPRVSQVFGVPSVEFEVCFSRAVTNLDLNDFQVLGTEGQTGATVASVTGSGTCWTVTVTAGTGSGSIHLNLINNGTIVDTIGLPLEGEDFTGGSDMEWIVVPAISRFGWGMLSAFLIVLTLFIQRKHSRSTKQEPQSR